MKFRRGALRAVCSIALTAMALGVPHVAVQAAGPSGGCVTKNGLTTCTFVFTGHSETWIVPPNTSAIVIDAYGASGGSGASSAGGKGAHITASFPVIAGDSLNITVAGKGGDYSDNHGGFGGGGSSYMAQGGAGGGGASSMGDQSKAFFYAGGGGGAGGDANRAGGLRGGAGGDSGSAGSFGADDGKDDNSGNSNAGWGGSPGTVSQGGAGGLSYSECFSHSSDPGSAGHGGGGNLGGGGGGGGLYGGGAGGDWPDCDGDTSGSGGGGGGASYLDGSATSASITDGIRSGNGVVRITYDAYAPVTRIGLSGQLGAHGWFTGPVTPTVSATDGTKVFEIRCVLDPRQRPQSFADLPKSCPYAPPVIPGSSRGSPGPFTTVNSNGLHTVYAAARDTLGHKGTPISRSFRIDRSVPEIVPHVNGVQLPSGWYRGPVEVTWDTSDPQSGIDTTTGCGAVRITSDGVTRLRCRATNGAGLQAQSTVTIRHDGVGPQMSLAAPTARSYTQQQWNAETCAAPGFCGTAHDADSGVDVVQVSIRRLSDGSYWSGSAFQLSTPVWVTASGTTAWTYPFAFASFPAAGTYSVTIRARDVAGNLRAGPGVTFTIH